MRDPEKHRNGKSAFGGRRSSSIKLRAIRDVGTIRGSRMALRGVHAFYEALLAKEVAAYSRRILLGESHSRCVGACST